MAKRNLRASPQTIAKAKSSCGELKSGFALTGIRLKAEAHASVVHRRCYGGKGQIK